MSPHDLVGEELNAVCFVMDYVEFHFNGAVLRALESPMLLGAESLIVFPEPGSRDALCSLIGASVAAFQVIEGKAIDVRLDNGFTVRVPLDREARVGPEAAHFVPGASQPLQAWQG